MGFLKLLNVQGIVGLVCGTALLGLLIIQKVETRHFRKQAAQFEQLYRGEVTAHAGTVANYRAAADAARAADKANADRVRTEQATINQEKLNALETRLADARDRARRLQLDAQGRAHTSGAGATPVPGLSPAPGRTGEAPGPAGLSFSERLIATEQAIQLDELIKWVKAQAGVRMSDENGPAAAPAARSGAKGPSDPRR